MAPKPAWHLARALGRLALHAAMPRHGSAHYTRKAGPQAALVVGGLAGSIAIDHGIKQLLKGGEPPIQVQEGRANSAMEMVNNSWNVFQVKTADEEQVESEGPQTLPCIISYGSDWSFMWQPPYLLCILSAGSLLQPGRVGGGGGHSIWFLIELRTRDHPQIM